MSGVGFCIGLQFFLFCEKLAFCCPLSSKMMMFWAVALSLPISSVRVKTKSKEYFHSVLVMMLNFLNLKRIYTRGIKQANKHCLMSVFTYNLKKYIKFTKNIRISACMQFKKNMILTNVSAFSIFFVLRRTINPNTSKIIFNLYKSSIEVNRSDF